MRVRVVFSTGARVAGARRTTCRVAAAFGTGGGAGGRWSFGTQNGANRINGRLVAGSGAFVCGSRSAATVGVTSKEAIPKRPTAASQYLTERRRSAPMPPVPPLVAQQQLPRTWTSPVSPFAPRDAPSYASRLTVDAAAPDRKTS